MTEKVLFIGPLPPPFSGPELSMKQFMESEVITNEFDIKFLRTSFRKSNKQKGKFGLLMIINFFKFFFQLILKLMFAGTKMVYYPITPTQVGWIGRDVWTILLAKLFNKKVIVHLRGSHFKLNFQKFNPLLKWMVSKALSNSDGAIVQANYLRDQFSPFMPDDKIHVLYQSVDIDEFSNNELTNYKKNKILVVGHMTKAKGYIDILKTIPDIVNEVPKVEFCFAGNIRKGERGVFYNQYSGEKLLYEDPFEAEEKILNSSLKSNYHNLGIVSGKEKYNLFKECDIFVSASYSEGFSRSLLEAMCMGKPLVYTPVGAHREVLKDGVNGICIEPGDLEQLKRSILLLLKDKKLRDQIGQENYSRVRKDFTTDNICTQFMQILKHVLNNE